MSSSMPDVRFEMCSQPRYLSAVRALIADVADRYGFDECACGQIALAVDEALSNVINHGYERRTDGRIWLSLAPQGPLDGVKAITIVIEDQARQVDLNKIRSRDLDDVRPGGLGVHLIRELMDEAVWEKRAEGGMRLTLVKRRDPTASQPTERCDTKGDPK